MNLSSKQLRRTVFTDYLTNCIYDKPMWEKWFKEDIFYIENSITINNDEYLMRAIPVRIVQKLQSKEDLIELNNKPYLDINARLNNAYTIEKMDEQIYLQSQYATDNFKSKDITYICWIWKNGYLEKIGECKYDFVKKFKKIEE